MGETVRTTDTFNLGLTNTWNNHYHPISILLTCCMLFVCSSVRALGTAAVDMCQVATGGADAYYHIGMHCWDIAASAIIVQEAGGVVTDTDGLYLTCDVTSHLCLPAVLSLVRVSPQAQSST